MKSLQVLRAGAATILLAGTLLGGCVVAPAPAPYPAGVVAVAPPASLHCAGQAPILAQCGTVLDDAIIKNYGE